MTNKPGVRVVVVGVGGQGREVGRMLLDAGHQVVGYVDDAPSPQNLALVQRQGVEFLGGVPAIEKAFASYYVTGIASGVVRESVSLIAARYGMKPLTYVHPSTTIGSDCTIGVGTILWPGARLTANIRLGQEVHVNQNVTIGHDATVADFATINPSAALSGGVTIGKRALIGASSVVLQTRTVGADARVGAAACVTKDVAESTTVIGVPARDVELT